MRNSRHQSGSVAADRSGGWHHALFRFRNLFYATHTEVTAVALIPCKRPSPSPHEMMLTVVANRRIASRMTLITTGISLETRACSI
jgi:hypothetical protein